MPSSSFFLKAGTVLFALSTTTLATLYKVEDIHEGTSFTNGFNFNSNEDPTHGFVKYTTNTDAEKKGLIKTLGNDTYIGVDYETVLDVSKGVGRDSVRIEGAKEYQHGLFVLDLKHMPGGICGTWPAFWSYGSAQTWPKLGEIDIIEGVNTNNFNKMVLHTDTNCKTDGKDQTGTQSLYDCALDSASGTSGCDVNTKESNAFGKDFNANGGGVYAMEWTSDFIKMWFFPRGKIPASITADKPDTKEFGTPTANFQGGCKFDERFINHHFIFDTTFCGDWAGNVYSQSTCPQYAGLNSMDSCKKFVAENPSAFKDAYWLISYFKAYTKDTSTPRSSSIASSTAASTRVSSHVSTPSSAISTTTSSVISNATSPVISTATSWSGFNNATKPAPYGSTGTGAYGVSYGTASSSTPAYGSATSSSTPAAYGGPSSSSTPDGYGSSNTSTPVGYGSSPSSSTPTGYGSDSSSKKLCSTSTAVQYGGSSSVPSYKSKTSSNPVQYYGASSSIPSYGSETTSIPVGYYGDSSSVGASSSTPCSSHLEKSFSIPSYETESPSSKHPEYPISTPAVYSSKPDTYSMSTLTTTYTTTYVDICSTGYTTKTTTQTVTYCPTPTPSPSASVPPPGWTVTTKVCTACAETPTTVTLTVPYETPEQHSSYPVESGVKSSATPIKYPSCSTCSNLTPSSPPKHNHGTMEHKSFPPNPTSHSYSVSSVVVSKVNTVYVQSSAAPPSPPSLSKPAESLSCGGEGCKYEGVEGTVSFKVGGTPTGSEASKTSAYDVPYFTGAAASVKFGGYMAGGIAAAVAMFL